MSINIWVVGFFGFFSLVGGFIGYIKAQSKASLVAGLISGILLLACAYGLMQGYPQARTIAILVSLALGLRFAMTLMKKRRVMPDLIMVVLSLTSLLLLIFNI